MLIVAIVLCHTTTEITWAEGVQDDETADSLTFCTANYPNSNWDTTKEVGLGSGSDCPLAHIIHEGSSRKRADAERDGHSET